MIKPYDKEASAKIKDEILNMLTNNPMTFQEIYAFYSKEHIRHAVSNWMISLKNYGLVTVDDIPNRTKAKYHRVGTKTFVEANNERMEENNKNRKKSYIKKAENKNNLPCSRIIRMEDIGHKSKGNKTKINPWQGYSTMDLL